jgi:hypothetical protein
MSKGKYNHMQKINYLHDMTPTPNAFLRHGVYFHFCTCHRPHSEHTNRIAVSVLSEYRNYQVHKTGFETLKVQWKSAVESEVEK